MRPIRTCTVDGCSDNVHGHGYCSKHYKRWRKTGTAELPPPRTCSIEGCSDLAAPGRKGWCGKHYKRWYKNGDPSAVAFVVGDDEARFWSKVEKAVPLAVVPSELGPCWPWTGDTDEAGYGLFTYVEQGKPKRTRAHRWLLGHLRGKPLTRDVVGEEDGCHRCDNPPCCNPAHLYVGTRKQNVTDAVERSRLWQLKKDVCPKGHPLDGVKKQRGATRRYCKTCEALTSRERRTVRRKTCKNGHPLEGDNVLLCKNGTRKCRTCDEARAAEAAERLRQRWAQRKAI